MKKSIEEMAEEAFRKEFMYEPDRGSLQVASAMFEAGQKQLLDESAAEAGRMAREIKELKEALTWALYRIEETFDHDHGAGAYKKQKDLRAKYLKNGNE